MALTERYLIRNVAVAQCARPVDVLIEAGRICGIAEHLEAGTSAVVEGRGGRLLPGLIDHHIHLFATAVREDSIDVSPQSLQDGLTLEDLIRSAAAEHDEVRAIGYYESAGPLLDRWKLDAIVPDVPVRIQYRTGSLWVLNSPALDRVLRGLSGVPSVFERDRTGRLTGRVWRGDVWLRSRDREAPPSLRRLGRRLARWGVTGVTDATATNDQAQVEALAQAIARDGFPQSVMVMSQGELRLQGNAGMLVGPVKILLDDHDLLAIDELIGRMRLAHEWGRAVAVHCTTTTQLALTMAALQEAGPMPGDRIEHGSMIPPEAVAPLRELGVTVVTQPGFVRERGDQYLQDVPAAEHADLYRCASLIAAGIRLAGSTDAPYMNENPWLAITAATERRTFAGALLGPDERLTRDESIALFCGTFADPGGSLRRVEAGAPADLCLLHPDASQRGADPVAATFIRGELVYRSSH